MICGTALYISAPADAHHDIDFDTHSCAGEPSPTPPTDPELTPPPTEPGDEDPEPPPDEPTPAPQNCMPDEGERIWGTRTVRFSTDTDGARPLKRIALYILSEEDAVPDAAEGQPLLETTWARGDDVRTYDTPFSWNSLQATPYNGTYRIRVEADTYPAFTGDEAHRETAQRVHLHVDNAPKAIAPPQIITATTTSVTLQWSRAVEPDVRSYEVYRAKTTTTAKKPLMTAFKPVGVTKETTYRDRVSPGVYWYSIRVTRRSVVTPEEGISSPLSAMSTGAEVKSLKEIEKDKEDAPKRNTPFRPIVSAPRAPSRLANAPDAPFAYKLPYDKNVGTLDAPFEGSREEGGTNDPRGPVLPVAVGMFLLSSALAVGRMPY